MEWGDKFNLHNRNSRLSFQQSKWWMVTVLQKGGILQNKILQLVLL